MTRSDLAPQGAGPATASGPAPGGAAVLDARCAGPVERWTERWAASLAFKRFYLAVLAVQGVHVVEHVIQLVQVEALGVPDDDALGVLGYVFQFNGTEEYLHLVFNTAYLASLYLVLCAVVGAWRAGRLPWWVLALHASYGPGLETWHMVEPGVIIRNVIRNGGCPCPGIGDAALGVTDTRLHFVYNLIAYAGTVLPAPWLLRSRPPSGRWAARPLRPARA